MTESSPIFADTEFTLTVDDVAEIREAEIRNLTEYEETLNDPDELEPLRRFARGRIQKTKQTVELFNGNDDVTVLGIAKAIFDKGAALEGSRVPVEQIITTVYDEVPEADLLYGLLRKNPWGYRLGQTRMALEAERNTPKRS